MNTVGVFGPQSGAFLEIGPSFARVVILKAGAVAALLEYLAMGFGGLIVINITGIGNLNG